MSNSYSAFWEPTLAIKTLAPEKIVEFTTTPKYPGDWIHFFGIYNLVQHMGKCIDPDQEEKQVATAQLVASDNPVPLKTPDKEKRIPLPPPPSVLPTKFETLNSTVGTKGDISPALLAGVLRLVIFLVQRIYQGVTFTR